MKIKLQYNRKLQSVKNVFNRQYPYLKLEFFHKPHTEGKPSAANYMVPHGLTLIDVSGVMKEGTLDIKPTQTVKSLELEFQNFGLPVQVFRRQKGVWIQTTHSDNMTLKEQNEKGRLSSAEIKKQIPEEADYAD